MRHAIGPTLVLSLALAACADGPPPVQVASSTMPPARVAECRDFALLDDRCTRAWYQCKTGESSAEATRKSCITAWEECCALPGQGARSRLGGTEAVTHH